MANITLSGTLLDPNSGFAARDKIRFTHKTTTGSTLKGSVSTLVIGADGAYSIDLQYGLVLVERRDSTKSQYINLGVVTVNADNPATTLPELLSATVPVSSEELIEFQSILADCVAAQEAAEAAAAEAAQLENNTGASLVGTSSGATVQQSLDALTAGQTGGVIVFATYALLDAYTPANATEEKSSFKVTNDSNTALNGYYSWVSGTAYTKDADLANGVIESGNVDAVSGGNVYEHTKNYFRDIDLNTEALTTETLILGWDESPIPDGGTNVGSGGIFVQASPVEKDGTIVVLRFYAASTGNTEIRTFDRSGNVFTKAAFQVVPVIAGYNEVEVYLPVLAGQYVGFVNSLGFVANRYAVSETADNGGWYYGSGTGDTFTDSAPSRTGRLGVAYIAQDRDVISGFDKRLVDNESETTANTGILESTKFALGYNEDPIPAGTDRLSVGNWVIATPINEDTSITVFRATATGAISGVSVRTFNKLGADFTKDNEIFVDLVAGYNEIEINLPVTAGQYVGINQLTASQINFTTETADNGGWYYGSGTGDTFTDSTPSSFARLHWAVLTTKRDVIDNLDERVTDLEQSIGIRPASVNLPFENMMIIGSGQSLMEGSQTLTSGTTPITTSQEFDNMCFQAKNGSNNLIFPATVINSQAATNRGEWPGLGCAGFLRKLLLNDNNINYTDVKNTIVIDNEGSSGAKITEINKGSTRYSSGITKAANLSSITGESAGTIAVIFMQGESEGATDPAVYKANLIQLASDYNIDLKVATGQTLDTKLYTYQLSTVNRDIGLAHLQASEESQLITLATPMYQFSYYDSLHVDSVSERLIGAYFAQAIKSTVLEGNNFKPLKPIYHTVIGNSITLTFNKSGLVFDNVLIPQQTNNGFIVKNDIGETQTISSINIVNGNQVKILLSSAPSSDWTIEYGVPAVGKAPYGGACGNLRDSAGVNNEFDNYPLHNWSVLFDYVL